tara:strand:+ start:363 stop:875 length:513 start_codon:yes stop_codon:yes gene_type:complete
MAVYYGDGSNSSAGRLIQTVVGTANLTSSIAGGAASPTATGLVTNITPKSTSSNFLITVAGFSLHNNNTAGNEGIKVYMYAQINGSGGYSNVLNNFAVSSHVKVSWIDFPGEFTVFCPNSAVSYTSGQYIQFQPYYQRGDSNSSNSQYFHHTGGSGSGSQCQTIIQEIAA